MAQVCLRRVSVALWLQGVYVTHMYHRYQLNLRKEPLKTKVQLDCVASGCVCDPHVFIRGHTSASYPGVQALTAGVLAALSELLAQRLAGNKTVHWRRAGALGVSRQCWP